MTKHEESTLTTYRKGFIGALGVLTVTVLCTGFGFYYTTKSGMQVQADEIKELKRSIKQADPEQIGRFKYRLQKIEDKMEEVQVQVNSAIRVMESFKADQERKSDRMLELLIEIKRNQ